MQIKHVKISNFRGIRQMEWSIDNPIVCLIGPGDYTKSTILDAIECVLTPNWNMPFDDCDFYSGDTNNPIEVIVTVGQIPDKLVSEQKFGLYLRGWSKTEGIHDEPVKGDEFVLSIRLRLDKSLEPEWTVTTDRDMESRISSKDRELLGMTRLGANVDRQLAWGRGSVLTHLTSDPDNAVSVITEANRKAQEAAKTGMIDEFKNVAATAHTAAKELGVKPKSDYMPALDPRAIGIGMGAISIHEGNIPLRQLGLGSRRLVALGLELQCVKKGCILLIDEVEYGLEPYRIRHLLNMFQQLVKPDSTSAGQIIMTSHSHTVIVELASEKLCVVQSNDGTTVVRKVGDALQDTVRGVPESLLGRKVLVCEGKTEYGFGRSLGAYWVDKQGKLPFAYFGTAVVEGGGDNAPQRALTLAGLGYATCLFIDSDKLDTLAPDLQTLKNAGVKVIHWDGKVSIEQRIALDLPWQALKAVIALAAEMVGEQGVLDAICSRLGADRATIGSDIDRWLERGHTEEQVRNAVGMAAKEKGWFKRVDHGEGLGNVVVQELANISTTDLAKKVEELSKWIYE